MDWEHIIRWAVAAVVGYGLGRWQGRREEEPDDEEPWFPW